jgi:hypothetical protein
MRTLAYEIVGGVVVWVGTEDAPDTDEWARRSKARAEP